MIKIFIRSSVYNDNYQQHNIYITYTKYVFIITQLYQVHAYILYKCIAEREITKCKTFHGRSLRYFSVLKEIAIMEKFRCLYSSFSAAQNVLNAICSNKNARTVQEILSSYYARERPKRIHRHELLKHFT